MNKISIITVVKNGMPYLKDAIKSFLAQDLEDKELIIVCADSNDGTYEYCKNIKENNIKIFFSDIKIYSAINFGIRHSNSNIIGILHSDDIFYSKSVLSNIYKLHQTEKFDVCYGSILYSKRNNLRQVTRIWKENNMTKKNYWTPPHTSTFIDKNKVNLEYDEKYYISSDTKYLLEIFKTNKLKKSFYSNYTTIMRAGGLSTSFKNFNLQKIKIREDLEIFSNFKLTYLDYLKKILSKYKQILFFKKYYLNDRFLEIFSNLENKIKLINSTNSIDFNKNFILSGLNLAFLAYYSTNKIIKTKNLINWPDGIFCKRFGKNIKKIAGRNLIRDLNLPEYIKTIHVIGNLEKKSFLWLSNLYKVHIKHSLLPYGNTKELECLLPTTNKSEICILTLPTPKQEQCAHIIAKKSDNYKIICIGGAINMASGIEREIPDILDTFGLEFIWRLKNDPLRRAKRLIETFFIYVYQEFKGKFKNLYVKQIK